MIKVAVVDDQAIVRSGLAALLRLEAGIEVVGEAADGAGALALAAEQAPDVLLLDIQMPAGELPGGAAGPEDGIAVAEQLTADGQRGAQAPRIIMLTTFGRAGYLRRAMEAGALGFMVKDAPVEQLVDAIRRVEQGLRVVDPDLAAQSLAVGPSPLTPKEADALRASARGASTTEIAQQLFVSEGTVRNHISAAIGKLGVANRAEAVRLASDQGWL